MTDDQKLASLLTECLTELDKPDRTAIDAIFAELEAIDPGSVERMAATLQLRKLGLSARH